MKVGIIGVGVVGGTLRDYLKDFSKHEIALWDPAKKLKDDLTNCSAIFISIPVKTSSCGQDIDKLAEVVRFAKQFTNQVFIRSTVLPGTNDLLGTFSMPEFLTARRAYHDMVRYPVVVSKLANKEILNSIFQGKDMIFASNTECEIAKYMHNCFGAMKVTYFNIFKRICDFHIADFNNSKKAANITGFLGFEHMQVPGHDGKFGYGGTCFPENINSLSQHLSEINSVGYSHDEVKFFEDEEKFFKLIRDLNLNYRGDEI
jgi:UDPglucose 6-dehydrogenase